jgi:hypothetical protein
MNWQSIIAFSIVAVAFFVALRKFVISVLGPIASRIALKAGRVKLAFWIQAKVNAQSSGCAACPQTSKD